MVQSWVPQYRRAFYNGLRDRLVAQGIDFHLVHGQAFGAQIHKADTVTLPWSTVVDARTFAVASKTLSWRPRVRQVAEADLIIATQKSSHLENYAFLARQVTGRQRFALWGHGQNFQNASPVGEFVKRALSRRVHWWFAYNELSAAVVRDLGFPEERITVVNNAIDTHAIHTWVDCTAPSQLDALRAETGLTGSNIGAFVGGLYAEKRLPYLVEACDRIRSTTRDFEMLVLGGGPDLAFMQRAAASRPWLHVLGPRFDEDKVRLLQLADVMLMPGLVGLAILDAFALGLPLVTVADSSHSPEVDYLDDGVNGMMLPRGTAAAAYGDAVAALLDDRARLRRMAEAGLIDSRRYTIANMVDRFADGVVQALDAGF
ncbi:MAG TPA: glycosyltransferase family 4 protein [Euzebya sp.]|nr:glycosyltransferase family 4 protein [Euzebya sp.]